MTRPWLRDPLTLAVTTLAAYRITRLLTADDFPPVETARRWFEDRLPDNYAHGVRCPWCVGFWAAAAVVAAAEAAHHHRNGHQAYLLAALPWALSTVTGLVAAHEPA